jgi:glutamate synthase domain-containing protein 3
MVPVVRSSAPLRQRLGMGDMLRHDAERLRVLLERHLLHTGSKRARAILDDWDNVSRSSRSCRATMPRALPARPSASPPPPSPRNKE